jgi:putative DNA methylase
VAVLLNKVVLEYIPRYGQRLADEVRRWGAWIKEQAERELAEFYPKDPDGATPIAYLWARTVLCEGPGCGAEIPLMRSLWLAKKPKRSVALRINAKPEEHRVDFEIIRNATAKDVKEGTVRKGSATCPCCGYTTPVTSVRQQLKARHGGAADARLFCVVTTQSDRQGRFYRLPTEADLVAVQAATAELERRKKEHKRPLSLVPDEDLDIRGIRHTWAMIYGLDKWENFYTRRQLLALTTISNLISNLNTDIPGFDTSFVNSIQTCLSLALSRLSDRTSSLCTWRPQADQEKIEHVFTRQALPMAWDFAEGIPFSEGTAGWSDAFEPPAKVIESLGKLGFVQGVSYNFSATQHRLPGQTAQALITDPPYYDAVPYAYLSDFFYVWLHRCLALTFPDIFSDRQVPKDEEIVVDRPHELSKSNKDIAFYERELTRAFAESKRVTQKDGIGTIVFASKTTSSWEAILQAVIDAGWITTGSWPIDTELDTRIAAQGQARLASSIHLVCRPRVETQVGDWREVLEELPGRVAEWMGRLTHEGVTGADAIFACLGPAIEIFSRYDRVERVNGDQVTLNTFLEYVWAAVAREALAQVFPQADATGFEEDARITALWLWTLFGGTANDNGNGKSESEDGAVPVAEVGEGDEAASSEEEAEAEAEESGATGNGVAATGYVLEYDAARKIAQGLGVHLEKLDKTVVIKGDKARLLGLNERSRYLFGGKGPVVVRVTRPKVQQLRLDMAVDGKPIVPDADWDETVEVTPGATTLDRLHQSMLLFGAGSGAVLKRFLRDDEVGSDRRFWALAQAMLPLYPLGSDERRMLEGVMTYKKSLGL